MPVRGSGGAERLHVGLTGGDNALNALRLVLASIVILEHSYSLVHGPGGPMPYAGGFAVDGFFAISGFLITGSRTRMGMRPYLWRRALRIVPAYWAVLLFTALVVAPVSAKITSSPYAWDEAGKYVTWNSMLVTPILGIGGSPHGVPYAGLWNGPLWTLTFEAGAYLFFGLLVALPGFGARTASRILIGLSVLTTMQFGAGVAPRFDPDLARLWAFFAAGVLLWFIRERLPSSPWMAVAAAGVVTGCLASNHTLYLAVAPLPLAFALLWLGARLPLRVGTRHDISYGLYLFAYPLQQLMIIAGVAASVGSVWFAVLSVAITVPVAWASWLLVERPSMRLRRLVPVGGRPTPVVPLETVAPAQ
ncbi:acyltransferase [Terrabacter sp. Root85]|uniref:acyltransferase family protein n=1 Tax=Terrabacter sp. Root85 TaxID=1736603 RepID=UPI0009EC2D0F|nr:acyltransferase [Terrabacter sp. Root85]